MKKIKLVKPNLAENPTDTVVVNAGEEITDNTVQKEELRDEVTAQNEGISENNNITEDTVKVQEVLDSESTDGLVEDSSNNQTDEVGEVVNSSEINESHESATAEIPDSLAEDSINNQTNEVGEVGLVEDANNKSNETEKAVEVTDSASEDLTNSQSNEVGDSSEEESIEEVTGRTLSPGRLVLKRFFRSKLSMTGLIILLILFVFSFFGPLFDFLPFIWGEREADTVHTVRQESTTLVEVTTSSGSHSVYDYENEDGNTVYIVTYADKSVKMPPSKFHLLGTDNMGYDVLSRLMYGGRISLTIGFVVIILETVIGVILGGIAGYFGKWVDQIIMRIVDIFNCVPTLPLLMIVGVALQNLQIYGPVRLYILMAMMTLFGWAGTARLVRGQILSLREQDFMLSAEASGLTIRRKIFKHLIPNVIPQLIVSMTLGLGSIILTEATLGYLGIGLPLEYATWGNMINTAANNEILRGYPNLWITPGICIVLAVLAFNFIGDGLRDAFDPKARR